MIGAIGAASGYDTIFSIGYSARANATGTDFRVPESPLTTSTSGVEGVASTPARDPIQDSVELSVNHPDLLVSQTYAPPMEQQIAFAIRGAQQPSSMAQSEDESDYLNNSDALLYSGFMAEEQSGSDENSDEDTTVNEAGGDNNGAEQLSEEEQQQVKELADRDREVRAHEQAHKSVGGAHSGAMSFEYQQGPDGQRYAVGGEVSIDISTTDDPQKTIAKMQQVRSAAMAPAEPSAQDYKVAAQASQQEAQARAEMNSSESESGDGEEGDVSEADAVNGEQDGRESQNAQEAQNSQNIQVERDTQNSPDTRGVRDEMGSRDVRETAGESTTLNARGTRDNSDGRSSAQSSSSVEGFARTSADSATETGGNTVSDGVFTGRSETSGTATASGSSSTSYNRPTNSPSSSGSATASLRTSNQFAQFAQQYTRQMSAMEQAGAQFQMGGGADTGVPYRSINIVA